MTTPQFKTMPAKFACPKCRDLNPIPVDAAERYFRGTATYCYKCNAPIDWSLKEEAAELLAAAIFGAAYVDLFESAIEVAH